MTIPHRLVFVRTMLAAALLLTAAAVAQAQIVAYQYEGPYGCKGCPEKPTGRGGPTLGNAAARSGMQRANRQMPPGRRTRRFGPPPSLPNPLPYDLLLQNGHVIDAKNGIDRVMDVAIKNGKIAAVGEHLNPKQAAKTIDVSGYYVTPGLIDINTHDYASTAMWRTYINNFSIWPDSFTFRNGVTTVVDAGSSGWRNFEDFKEHIIDRERTRILAFLNVVGDGLQPPTAKDDLADMSGTAAGLMAERYPGFIVGIMTSGVRSPSSDPVMLPYQQAIKAATMANVPVMIDYNPTNIHRPVGALLTHYLRPKDIYSRVYSGLQNLQKRATLQPEPALIKGRTKGVYFDSGNGSGGFRFRAAVPLIKAGFLPDSISSGLDMQAANGPARDLDNVMGTFLAMGLTLRRVIADTTWHPAQEIHQPQLGNLSVGSPADVAVFSLDHGKFGFSDSANTTLAGNTRLVCELTIRDGRVVYDLDGLSMDPWNDLHPSSNPQMAVHWTIYRPRPIVPVLLNPRQSYDKALLECVKEAKQAKPSQH